MAGIELEFQGGTVKLVRWPLSVTLSMKQLMSMVFYLEQFKKHELDEREQRLTDDDHATDALLQIGLDGRFCLANKVDGELKFISGDATEFLESVNGTNLQTLQMLEA